MMIEWRPIIEFEGLYEVSNDGQVRSLARMKKTNGGSQARVRERILKPLVHKRTGHLYVVLYKGEGAQYERQHRRAIHQLVLEAFVGPRPQGMGTRHLNGQPSDNRLENLCYGTQLENMADQRKHGTHWATKKKVCPKCGGPFKTDKRGKRFCPACKKH